jgi:hypothetical protein
MHQSSKEKIVLKPENRMLSNDFQESIRATSGFYGTEFSEEWHTDAAPLKQIPRKTYR